MKLRNFLDKAKIIDEEQFEELKKLIKDQGLYQAFRQVDTTGDFYVDNLFKLYISTWEALEFVLDTMDFNIIGKKC